MAGPSTVVNNGRRPSTSSSRASYALSNTNSDSNLIKEAEERRRREQQERAAEQKRKKTNNPLLAQANRLGKQVVNKAGEFIQNAKEVIGNAINAIKGLVGQNKISNELFETFRSLTKAHDEQFAARYARELSGLIEQFYEWGYTKDQVNALVAISFANGGLDGVRQFFDAVEEFTRANTFTPKQARDEIFKTLSTRSDWKIAIAQTYHMQGPDGGYTYRNALNDMFGKTRIESWAKEETEHENDESGADLRTGSYAWPVKGGVVTDVVRYRKRHPVHGGGRMHWGIDIGAPMGTPILAADGGVVKFVGFKGRKATGRRRGSGYGYTVIIDHGNGQRTLYAHLKEMPPLKIGQRVRKGQPIGKMGSTGSSTGPHLHFEVRKNGKPTNINYLLKQWGKRKR